MTKRSVPDFAEYAPKGFLYRNIDPTELAVRLGSVNTFNRSGDVIFQDGFESGLAAFYDLAPGTGAETDITPVTSRNGGFSCKMISGLYNDDATSLSKNLAYPFITKIGFEFSFSLTSTLVEIYASIIIYTDTEQLKATIEIEPSNKRISYYANDGSWPIIISDLNFTTGAQWFYTIKFIVDFENRIFDNLFFLKDVYDLSMYGLRITAGTYAPLLSTRVYIYPTSDVNRTLYVDDWIVTINEP